MHPYFTSRAARRSLAEQTAFRNILRSLAVALSIYALGVTVCVYLLNRGQHALCGRPSGTTCRPGWYPVPEFKKCLKVFFGQTSTITAAQACHAMDAGLLALNSIEEEYFVLNMEVGGEPLRNKCEFLLLSPWSEGSGQQLTGPKGEQRLYSNFVDDEPQKMSTVRGLRRAVINRLTIRRPIFRAPGLARVVTSHAREAPTFVKRKNLLRMNYKRDIQHRRTTA
ncbi:unnamed protein product, partial [Mesorhabditis spiculigera]